MGNAFRISKAMGCTTIEEKTSVNTYLFIDSIESRPAEANSRSKMTHSFHKIRINQN